MKIFKLILGAALAALFVSGCASDKELARAQADAQIAAGNVRVAEAQAAAEEARAVQALAAKLDAGGATAYLLAKAMKGIGGQAQPVQVVQQPQSVAGAAWQAILQVADIGLRGWGLKINRDVAVHTSDNNRDVAVASYGAFTSMGQAIATAGTAGYPYVQAPAANVTTTTTLSGTGVIGNGTYTGPVTTTITRNCNGGTAAPGGAGTTGTAGQGGNAPGGNC